MLSLLFYIELVDLLKHFERETASTFTTISTMLIISDIDMKLKVYSILHFTTKLTIFYLSLQPASFTTNVVSIAGCFEVLIY